MTELGYGELGFQVAHAIAGRTRLRIPWLKTDVDAAGKLQRLLESLNFVTSVRINPLAESIIITYRAQVISSQEALEQFAVALQQVKPTPAAPASTSVAEEPMTQAARTSPQTVSRDVAHPAPSDTGVLSQQAAGNESDSLNTRLEEKQQPQLTISNSPKVTAAKSSPNSSTSASKPKTEIFSEIPSPWDETDSEEPPAEILPAEPSPRESDTPVGSSSPNVDLEAKSESGLDASSTQDNRVEIKVEETGAELVGETIGGEVGALTGGILGELVLGPIGAVVGEELGTLAGEVIGSEVAKQAVENVADHSANNVVSNSAIDAKEKNHVTGGSMTAPEESISNLDEDSAGADHDKSPPEPSARKSAAKKSTRKRIPHKPG